MTGKKKTLYPANVFQSIVLTIFSILVMMAIYLLFEKILNNRVPSAVRDFFAYGTTFLVIHLICQKQLSDYNFKMPRFKILFYTFLGLIFFNLGVYTPIYRFVLSPELGHMKMASVFPNASVIITLLFIGPIFEELIFRGIILNGLQKNGKGILSIVITSILFAFIHLNIELALSLFLFGIFLGWIFLRTKSILLVAFLHLFNNLISSIQVYHFHELRVGQTGISKVYGENTMLIILLLNLLLILCLSRLRTLLFREMK